MKKNKVIGFLVSLAAGIVFFVIVFRRVKFASIANLLNVINGKTIIAVVLFYLASFACSVWCWYLINKKLGIKMSLSRHIVGMMIGNAFTYLTPAISGMGETTKVIASAEEHNESKSQVTAGVLVQEVAYLIILVALVLLGAIYTLIKFIHSESIWVVVLFMAILAVILLAGFFLYSVILYASRMNKLKQAAPETEELTSKTNANWQNWVVVKTLAQKLERLWVSVKQIMQNGKQAIWQALAISFLEAILSGITWWCLLWGMGYHLNLAQYSVIWSLMYMASWIPIPANLGSMEMGQVAAFNMLKLACPQTAAVAFSLAMRGINLVFVVIGLILAAVIWLKILAKNAVEHVSAKTANFLKRFYKILTGQDLIEETGKSANRQGTDYSLESDLPDSSPPVDKSNLPKNSTNHK